MNTPEPEKTKAPNSETQETETQGSEAQGSLPQDTEAQEAEAAGSEEQEAKAQTDDSSVDAGQEAVDDGQGATVQVAEVQQPEEKKAEAEEAEPRVTEAQEPTPQETGDPEAEGQEVSSQETGPQTPTAAEAAPQDSPAAEPDAETPASEEAASEEPQSETAQEAAKEKPKEEKSEGTSAPGRDPAQVARSNQARLISLAERLESLVADEDLVLRKVERALRDAQNALQKPPTLPDGNQDWEGLKKRLEAAQEVLVPRVRQMEQEEEWKQWANVPLQEALITRMEAMVETEDLAQATKELRVCSEEWKKVASAPREKSEELWQRFRTAREKVRERVKIYQQDQDKERKENLVKKLVLCEQAEALSDSQDWKKTADLLKNLQAQWKSIGPVPRKHSDEVWKRFRGACDLFFGHRKEHFASLDKEREGNLERKVALCEKAEVFAESTDWEGTTRKLKALQDEWKHIGPVPRKVSDEIWRRFRGACDRFFDRRSRKDELPYEENLVKKEAACAELEALLPAEGSEAPEVPEEFSTKLAAAREAWKKAGEVPRSRQPALERRFATVTAGLIAAFPEALAGTDWDPVALAERRGKLADKAEALIEELRKTLAEQDKEEQPSLQDLARQLKEALAANTIRKGPQASAQMEAWTNTKGKLAGVRQRWMELPGAASEELEARFRKAFDDFTELEPKKAS